MRKSKFFVAGMLALALGLVLTGCGSGKPDTTMNGKWVLTDGPGVVPGFAGDWYEMENGTYEDPVSKGTYTVKGSTITFKETHSKLNADNEWQSSSGTTKVEKTSETTFEKKALLGIYTYTKQ